MASRVEDAVSATAVAVSETKETGSGGTGTDVAASEGIDVEVAASVSAGAGESFEKCRVRTKLGSTCLVCSARPLALYESPNTFYKMGRRYEVMFQCSRAGVPADGQKQIRDVVSTPLSARAHMEVCVINPRSIN